MRGWRVRGLVQGVGFRPCVWRLAREMGLSGWVRNDAAGVTLALQADAVAAEALLTRLRSELPLLAPLARIDAIEEITLAADDPPLPAAGFVIVDSLAGAAATAIGPDAAICPACIAEMCDPAGRRWRHAFITCTHCGPRYTVSAGIPYDRARTSLAPFPLCPSCAAEYADPADRRFHAETTCCPACGPRLQWREAKDGRFTVDRESGAKSGVSEGASGLAPVVSGLVEPAAGDPIAITLAWLRAGRIVALKGLGGFHLACDADNPAAVAELRRRKARDAKPFAVMALNAASVADLAQLAPADEALLRSPAAPIVLCTKGPRDLPGVAPGLGEIGLLRPGTPLHLLLWHEAAGRPAGVDWMMAPSPLRLVMTSANPGGEPLVIDNAEAVARLAGIADAFLLHDRAIVVRCDDSLLRSTALGPQFLRRARGYAPLPLRLPAGGTPGLALGGYLKNTICVLRGEQAFLSQHVGSLDNAATLAFLDEAVTHLLAILDVRPAWVAHDAHPDYPSTQLAQQLAARWGVPALAVPHHAAHLAAVAAEYGERGPLLGLALDGVGLGSDGGLWGGELLALDLRPEAGEEAAAVHPCRRLGQLRPLALPGGDRAAREPWRMAVAALHALGYHERISGWLAATWPEQDLGPLLQMLDRGLRCPPTSSLGRVFDAAAGLLGLRAVAAYEGQAAMELEALARCWIVEHGEPAPLADGFHLGENAAGRLELDLLPLLATLAALAPSEREARAAAAALFHVTLAAALEKWLLATVDRESGQKPGGRAIAGDGGAAGQPAGPVCYLAGGCAQNTLLVGLLAARLAASGGELRLPQQAPANDGGLALGQAWWARCHMI
ncbi:carbamoyltransferase HypF [Dechloromonas sp. ZY10]|uniref:carbamoyltransferase HypF n=1 Tax=Dechloromonas aquae TaxID=2664436 RepID=UPI003527F522